MRKTLLMTAAFLTCSLFALAASPAVGTWDCLASVDQDYPFVMEIVEQDGELSATAESSYGEAGPVENMKLEGNTLTFTIDTSSAGKVDFTATVDGDTMKGTLESWDFGGDFSAKRQE